MCLLDQERVERVMERGGGIGVDVVPCIVLPAREIVGGHTQHGE